MRVVIQRVASAQVSIGSGVVSRIGAGLLVLLGVAQGDTAEDGEWLVQKIAALRILADAEGKMNLSLHETDGGILVVSQFTLIASTRKGARPSFNDAAKPDFAVPLYEEFVRRLELRLGRTVQTGRFGAHMQLALVNDGPVTLVIDSRWRE